MTHGVKRQRTLSLPYQVPGTLFHSPQIINPSLNRMVKTLEKFVRGHSQTQTDTEEEKKHSVILDPNTLKEWSWTKRLHKGAFAAPKTGHVYYDTYFQKTRVCDMGRQMVDDLMYLANAYTFKNGNSSNVFPQVGIAPESNLPEGLLQLDPEAKAVASRDSAETFGSTINPNRYVNVHSIACKTTYTSLAEIPLEVDVFWCLAKRNLSRGPTHDWRDSELSGQEVPTQAAVNSNDNVNPGWPRADYPGQLPFTSKKFNANWKIVHRDSFTLQKGSSVKINSKIFLNKRVYLRKIQEIFDISLNSDGAGSTVNRDPLVHMAGITVCPMWVVKGGSALYVDDATGYECMTYAPVKVGVLCHQKYHVTFGEGSTVEQLRRTFPSVLNKGPEKNQNIKIMDYNGDVDSITFIG